MKSLVLAVICLSAVSGMMASFGFCWDESMSPWRSTNSVMVSTPVFIGNGERLRVVPPSDGKCDYQMGRLARLEKYKAVVPADWKRCVKKYGHKSPHKFE